ncbi:hypothetical protein [Methanolobus halotolerans]|uniref:Uncharacterized protein n=1 Tax=Methanolobus halotolerans TaxID=2052935 RepID=A0A4E0QXR8_9EURY|nr:hypothetical protein [Methanolobus halotolerans]TGC08141.1 hypothetical protein CUN85_09975 [Methanolobus halotolerans]
MNDEKKIKEDINGRLHSQDQELRSVEKRLRAVERRLSRGDMPEDDLSAYDTDLEKELEDTREGIVGITQELESLKSNAAASGELTLELQSLRQQVTELGRNIHELQEDNARLADLIPEDAREGPEQFSTDLMNEMAELRERLEKAEKRSRINIGSMQVPLEMSGIIGALILVLTGALITAGRWDIIRSPYFSFGIAFIFVITLLMKFYLTNRAKA